VAQRNRPMALQEVRPEGAAGRHGGDAEAARQRGIFEARREELLAAHPDMYIAVCAGEVFAGPSVMWAVHMATRAHPGRPMFLYSQVDEGGQPTEEEAARLEERGVYAWRRPASHTPEEAARIQKRNAEDARRLEETARQRGIFEARREELLAAHPGKHIAVCAGEVFTAGTATRLDQMVMRAHPGRPMFHYSPGCASVSIL